MIKRRKVKEISRIRGDGMAGRKIIVQAPFKCSHIEEGFKGIDVFIVKNSKYYRLRYNREGLFIAPMEIDERYNVLPELKWTRLKSLELDKYVNPNTSNLTSGSKVIKELNKSIKKYFGMDYNLRDIGYFSRLNEYVETVIMNRECFKFDVELKKREDKTNETNLTFSAV